MKQQKHLYYLDHNATTPLGDRISEQWSSLQGLWGNPSSIHWASRDPKMILRETRKKMAAYLDVHPLELIFNSGASESNNTVIKSVYQKFLGTDKNHFICSSVEHPSVLQTMKFIQKMGAIVDFVPVNRQGQMDLDFLKSKLSSQTALVSIMFANNETGNVFPIEDICRWAHEKGALFHTDAVQVLGKRSVNLKELGVDYASFSAHKFYALKGCGVLYVKKTAPYENLIHGGGQERARRGGTENILGIASLGIAINELSQVKMHAQQMMELRDYMETRIANEIKNVSITGRESERLPNTSSLILDDVEGETLLMGLDLKGFAVSTGAACSSGNPEPSHVLLAMGLTRREAQSSLRVSLGWKTKKEEIDLFLNALKEIVNHVRLIKETL